MAMVFGEVVFDSRAPTAEQVAAKMTELCGLPVTVEPNRMEGLDIHDQDATLAFRAVPEEQLLVFSYRPGAAKEFYNSFMPGFQHLPTARYAVGLNEAAGTQSIYLQGTVVEPTLWCVAVLAMEALGGRPTDPLDDAERREYSGIIDEADLIKRRRTMERNLWWSAVLYIFLLPITIPWMFASLLVALALAPWKLRQAVGIYKQHATRIEHSEFLDGIPNRMTFVEADLEDFPALDRASLHRYTQGLLDLGFVHHLDYSMRCDVVLNNVGFARLFIHPEHHCFAELGQVFPHEGNPSTLRCMIASLLEQEWELGTSDREPIAMSYAWRRPRSLWSCHLKVTLDELLAEHLRRRQEMLDQLRIAVRSDLSTDLYFEHERQTMADRKAALSVKTIETIRAELTLFETAPMYAWLGDFTPGERT